MQLVERDAKNENANASRRRDLPSVLSDRISRDAGMRPRDRDDLEKAGGRERGGGRPGKVASSVATRHYVSLTLATAMLLYEDFPAFLLLHDPDSWERLEREIQMRLCRSKRSYQKSLSVVQARL